MSYALHFRCFKFLFSRFLSQLLLYMFLVPLLLFLSRSFFFIFCTLFFCKITSFNHLSNLQGGHRLLHCWFYRLVSRLSVCVVQLAIHLTSRNIQYNLYITPVIKITHGTLSIRHSKYGLNYKYSKNNLVNYKDHLSDCQN